MLRTLRWLSNLLPRRTETEAEIGRGEPPNPKPPDDGTVPVTAQGTPPGEPETPATATPTEPTDPGPPQETPAPTAEESAALARAEELRQANERIKELEMSREDEINRLAEERLIQLLPELPGEIEAERARRAQPPGQPQDPTEQYEPSGDERLSNIETRQAQLEAEADTDKLLAVLDGHREKYPHIDMGQVLTILARAGDREVNVERLCELSHNTRKAEMEAYHQERLGDAEYMKTLVTDYYTEHGQNASPPPIPPKGGAPAATPQVGVINRGNATATLEERLRSSGFMRSEVGAKPE